MRWRHAKALPLLPLQLPLEEVTVRFWVAKYQEYQASEPDLLIRMRGYKYRLDV